MPDPDPVEAPSGSIPGVFFLRPEAELLAALEDGILTGGDDGP
ncbi:MAG: hypothetical protein AAGF23_20435 [Acidobacteriota bacterium]